MIGFFRRTSMTKLKTALALLCFFSAAAPLAAQSFEGTVSMNLTPDNGSPQQLTFQLEGGKMRFEPVNGQVSVIIDPATQRMMVILNAQRMYMERDFGSAIASMQQQAGVVKTPTIVHTKTMDVVAGYKCEHVTITDDDGVTVDACISSELGGFRLPAASNPMAPQHEATWVAQLGSGSFPLKVVKGGKTLLEVTAIKKEALDAALFTAPEGFQSFAMPATKKPPLQ
jgi:hypothetical protein